MSVSSILQLPLLAPTQADKETTINDLIVGLEGATNDLTTVSLAAGDVTLTAYQYTRYMTYFCSGHTVGRNLIIPATKRVFAVKNLGTGSIVVGHSAGVGVTVAAGDGAIIQTDGTTPTLLGSGGPGPAGGTGPAGVISTIVAGAGLIGGTITTNGATIDADWQAGSVAALATGLSIATGGTLTPAFQAAGAGIDINTGGVVAAHFQLGTVTALGAGLTIIGQTLQATAFGGTVTDIVAGAGLDGGSITNSGTIKLSSIADGDILANTAGISSTPVATSLTAIIDHALGSTQGDVLYRSGSAWTVLGPGTAGYLLQTGGAAANPSWTPPASGSVTSVTAGAGLAGGSITGSGTISLATIADADVLANTSGSSGVPVATTVSALLDHAIGSTQGDILYRSGSAWSVLAPGTSGWVLTSGGASANPSWVAPATGTMTSLTAGAGLSGGTITGAGTIAADWHGGTVATIGHGILVSSGTISAPSYTLGFFAGGTLSASQEVLRHQFREAVTLPASLGANSLSVSSAIASGITATASTVLALKKCPSASDATVDVNFTQFGTVTFALGGHAATVTTGGTATPFAAGDVLKIVGPASPDTTLANVTATIVGDRS